MRIAWFTPWSSKSAIARYSRLVATELARMHDVEIWTFCTRGLLPASIPVHSVESHAHLPSWIRDYDVTVYQLGNYWPFHGEIWLQAQRHPGIVVLHDFVMQGFFAEYFFEHLRSPAAYVNAMRAWHGDAGASAAEEVIAGTRPRIWESDDMTRFPMLAGVTARSLGVAAHSRFVIDSVTPHYLGPVASFPLPYESRTGRASRSRRQLNIADDQLLVVTVGHVNPNKRVGEAIRALGALPEALKQRVVYAVLGPVEESQRIALSSLAKDVGIDGAVRFNGYTTDQLMDAFIAHADLCLNLRYPNTEGASASLIEQLLAGKAVVTNETGWFAELPSDVIRRVPANNTRALAHALEELLVNPEERVGMARRAYEYAHNTFRADLYAEGFQRFVDSTMRLTAVSAFADSVGGRIHKMGVRLDHAWPVSLAKRVSALFATAGHCQVNPRGLADDGLPVCHRGPCG